MNVFFSIARNLPLFYFLVDGTYVTTRGCSTFQWEDIDEVLDHRNQHIRCFRRGLLERCLCQYDGCNSATTKSFSISILFAMNLLLFGYFQWTWNRPIDQTGRHYEVHMRKRPRQGWVVFIRHPPFRDISIGSVGHVSQASPSSTYQIQLSWSHLTYVQNSMIKDSA